MKYYCKCGKELKKEDMGAGHYYYNCSKVRGGCGLFYGILGERYWWNVPAIDEFTGEIVYEITFSVNGSYRTPKAEKMEEKRLIDGELLTLTELQGKLSGCPTKHILAKWAQAK